MKKKLCLALSGALCLSAGVGCGTETAEETLTPVRLNEVVHSVFYAPQYVAQELGFFEEEGVDVSVAVGTGADKSMTALLSDSADIALLGTEAGLYVYAEGKADYPKTFAQLTQRAGNFLVSREEEYIIKENGMSIGKDMEIINNIDFTSTAGAFLGEVGDYTVEFEPAATTLEQSGKGHIVASLGEASGYVPYTVYMAQDAFLQAHPDVVEAFTRAIYKGQQWVESHSAAEIAKVIQPQFAETDLDTLTTIVERYQKQDTWKTDPTVSPEGFVLIQKIMMEGKELSQEIPYDSIVVTEFAEKVMTGK